MNAKTLKSIVASAVAALAGVSTAQAVTNPQYVGPRFRITSVCPGSKTLRVHRVMRTKATSRRSPNICL